MYICNFCFTCTRDSTLNLCLRENKYIFFKRAEQNFFFLFKRHDDTNFVGLVDSIDWKTFFFPFFTSCRWCNHLGPLWNVFYFRCNFVSEVFIIVEIRFRRDLKIDIFNTFADMIYNNNIPTKDWFRLIRQHTNYFL